jgi:hypothetical protein
VQSAVVDRGRAGLPIHPVRARGWLRAPVVWLAALIASVCFEGLGRKFLPEVPSLIFYFTKDAVLVYGLMAFGLRPSVVRTAKSLYRGFGLVLGLACAWTIVQVANPEQHSILLALLGLRSYWLWWLAPLVIASALRQGEDAQRVLVLLAVTAAVVAVYAAVQFASPPDAAVNTYALYRGDVMADVTVVEATGRARVSATFSYISGFAGFVTLVPVLLLSLGLGASIRWVRVLSVSAVVTCAAVTPMSGSRGPVVLSLLGLVAVATSAGLHRTRIGRRVIAAGAVVVAAAMLVVPDAYAGLRSRFEGADTRDRLAWTVLVFPPVALAEIDYPFMGIGTGMQQNAAKVEFPNPRYYCEPEYGRFLVELGVPGYLLVWTSRLGLFVALIRAARRLLAARERGLAGAAVAFAVFTMIGGALVFDHVWQALYFLGVGLILQAVVALTDGRASPARRDGALVRGVRG